MGNALTRPAELYLERLSRALWPLASNQRQAIVLEIRGHLEGSAAGGRLEDALAGLGAPEALAGHFLDAGADRGGIAPAPVESGRGLSGSQVFREVQATWRAGRNGLFLVGAVLVTTLTATNFLLWLKALRPDISLEAWPVMLLRTLAVILALAAAYRLLLSERRDVWRLDRSTLPFAGALIVSLVASAAVAVVLARGGTAVLEALGVERASLGAAQMVLAVLWLAVAAITLLRVQPWIAGLAAGRGEVSLRASWIGTRGRMGSIAKGWTLLVFPLYLLHFALSFAAVKLFPLGVTQLALAGLDGIVSTLALLAAASLNATLFRWVAGEPIPGHRPFGTEPPSPEQVEAARLRLGTLLQAGAPVRS
ncbi:MAG TPA: hypothetical protein VEZ70_09860 [Allosphingosinicella sp.]|nr:hypothetical protein [Allosphingosinicella sp.]